MLEGKGVVTVGSPWERHANPPPLLRWRQVPVFQRGKDTGDEFPNGLNNCVEGHTKRPRGKK